MLLLEERDMFNINKLKILIKVFATKGMNVIKGPTTRMR